MRGMICTIVLVLLCAGVAAAQDTGGSFGGGDWSDSGGGGGGDWSSSSSSSDYSSSSYDSGSSYSGGGGAMSGGQLVIVVIGVIIWIAVMVAKQSGAGRSSYASYSGGSAGFEAQADVTVLRFALDARTRPFVQKELDRIAKVADMKTKDGRATALHEVAIMLRRLRDGWVYGGAHNFPMTAKSAAHGSFQHHVAAARALFQRELVRNAQGTVTTGETREFPRRSDEGAGLVLVTVVVAASQELFTVPRIGDGDNLRRALEVLTSLTAQTLVAMEVVWTPADPEDRMSSVELEALLPGEVFPIDGAMVGKVICAYCGGPFPKELLSCPHCGGRLQEPTAA